MTFLYFSLAESFTNAQRDYAGVFSASCHGVVNRVSKEFRYFCYSTAKSPPTICWPRIESTNSNEAFMRWILVWSLAMHNWFHSEIVIDFICPTLTGFGTQMLLAPQ